MQSRTGAGAGAAGGPSHFDFDFYQLGFDASYEVDMFGRVTRSIEAAHRDAQAAAAALDGARISIAAQVAQSYADACGFAAQADVARETARLEGNTRDLTQRLLDAGRGTRRDVDQAAVLVEQANAQVPQLEGERRAQLYALAALTGRPPAELDVAAAQCRAVPKVATVIPVGDGAALLARRPDVRAAERTLAADTARIGIATVAALSLGDAARQRDAGCAAYRHGRQGQVVQLFARAADLLDLPQHRGGRARRSGRRGARPMRRSPPSRARC